MAKLDYGNMAKGIKKRFGVLSEYEQQAVEAIVEVWDYSLEEALDIVERGDIVEVWDYSLEEALDIVERGDYEFHPEISTLVDLAHKFVNPRAIGLLEDYINYEKFAADLYEDNYRETSLGVIRALSNRDRYRQGFPDRGY